MTSRIIGLPLVLIALCLVALIAAFALGAIPLAVGPAVLSGAIAAVLTSSLGFWGIWVGLRHQAERERFERLRLAYADLIRAADSLTEAMTELMLYPKGRPSPYGPTVHVTSFQPLVPSYPPKEVAEYNPYASYEARLDTAMELARLAEALVFVEEGEESSVNSAWEKVREEFNGAARTVAGAVPESTPNLEEHHRRFNAAVIDLRTAAFKGLRKIRLN